MNTAITLSYLLIFGGIVIWCLLLPAGKMVLHSIVGGITAFGGAFPLAWRCAKPNPKVRLQMLSTRRPDIHP